MEHTIKKLLAAWHIDLVAPLSLADCSITRPYLLTRAEIGQGTAILFAVPYYTTQCDLCARNISVYAVSADYHGFFAALFADILPKLEAAFPKNRFVGYSDHAPIDEREAAVKAGIGFWGCNHLLLTEQYSSYIFIGEIITDALLPATPKEPRHCPGCGACAAACPVGLDTARCHSALTQKKGILTPEERVTLCHEGSAWGCDICQEACPITKKAKECGSIYTNIPYFKDSALPHLTVDAVTGMSDADFARRAYAWRGRETILRNLKLLEGEEEKV